MSRRLMIEVTEEEYEIIRKGIKLSDMRTEDLVYELISRCDDKEVTGGSRSVLSGTADISGSIVLPKDMKEFQFKLINRIAVKVGPKIPYLDDPFADTPGTFNLEDALKNPFRLNKDTEIKKE